MIILILCVFLTLLSILFVVELKKDNRIAAAEIVISKMWNYRFSRQNLEEKKESFLKENEKYHRYSKKKADKKIKAWDKQIADYRMAEEAYGSGKKFSLADGVTLFGYQLLKNIKLNAENEMFRKTINHCECSGYLELERGEETGGQKNSFIYAYYLLASLFSYAFTGMFFAGVLAILMIVMGKEIKSVLIISLAVFLGLVLLGYLPYDGLNVMANKRQEEIDREFPNVISKVALLVTAGMNILKALEKTAESGDTTIYLELQKAIKEINQASSLETALVHMQCRCNNRYLDKMVSVISKSYVAGNANLADNLREINGECWLDKKHHSRRMSEAVQNKLFVPTMLMFIGILVVIMIPAMSGFHF